MLLEKSFQAQVLIPMATSLAFGLLASTMLVLLMVPFLYKVYATVALTEEQRAGHWEPAPSYESVPDGSREVKIAFDGLDKPNTKEQDVALGT
jgi:hypothetical protein